MSIYENLKPLQFEDIKTYELRSRPSKITVGDFAGSLDADSSLQEYLDNLPNILAVKSIRELSKSIKRARKLSKPVIWGIGGHVIKTGLSPILIDLMKQGFLTAIASNGSVLVHDTEIALEGFTSEDVDATLGKGDFGAAKETGEILNKAASRGQIDRIGLGEAVCREVAGLKPKFADYSVLCEAFDRKIPVTAHLTIGADIGHFHASADGAALGETSHRDFKLFCSLINEMNGGGVYLNYGSAVTLPEIFLKAITINRNLGNEVKGITTANFDFIQHYRPNTNVVRRPNANGAGKGYSVTGHHELTLPLLAAHLVCEGKD
ncbi:MAG: hypothetical protein HKN25_11580 [Pyrinomonadaceae bacterium]|nr:hypothetical protein [Pyrinomonadaceae bacterium]